MTTRLLCLFLLLFAVTATGHAAENGADKRILVTFADPGMSNAARPGRMSAAARRASSSCTRFSLLLQNKKERDALPLLLQSFCCAF